MFLSLDTVLVSTDLSDLSFMALDAAVDLTEIGNGRLVVLTVVKPQPSRASSAERARIAEVLLRERLKDCGAPRLSIVVEESADAASAIVETAQRLGAGVIVMATRGCGEAPGNLGSVTEAVLRTSPIPVLALREVGSGFTTSKGDAHPEMWAG